MGKGSKACLYRFFLVSLNGIFPSQVWGRDLVMASLLQDRKVGKIGAVFLALCLSLEKQSPRICGSMGDLAGGGEM